MAASQEISTEAADVGPINLGSVQDITPLSGVNLSKRLQRSMLKLKGKFMSEDGKFVDYSKMRVSQEFKEYQKDALDLQRVDLSTLSEKEKKVFFLNIYNALTIHGLLEKSNLPDSVLSVQHFFKSTKYNIGGLVYSLDDIEHGILRCNSAHPASIKPQFSSTDPRLKYICQKLDPCIHFALVCGAKSCPAIGVYTVENIDDALDNATKNFCSQEVVMRTETNEVYLSKIFQWYRADFGETEVDVLRWIMPFLSPTQHDRCSILLLKLEKMGPVALRYNTYDWSLNTS